MAWVDGGSGEGGCPYVRGRGYMTEVILVYPSFQP